MIARFLTNPATRQRFIRYVRRVGPLGVRIFALSYCLYWLTPASPRLNPEPPQVEKTEHPLTCVHTRLTDEVEDWKIQRSLQLVREIGASTIVEFLPWAYVEHQKGVYDWSHPDRIITMARDQGLQIIVRLGIIPAWARPDPLKQQTTQNYLSPDHYADYARYVGAFVSRYRGKVDKIIAWNEPNLGVEWGGQVVTPEQYTDFLRMVYAAAHQANPDIMVLGGALAPTIEPPGSPYGWDDIDYLRGMYQAGAGQYFDALAVHTYGFTEPPDEAPEPKVLNFRRFELLLSVMRDYGDGNKPVYITESGWNDHPRWTKAVHPGQRVQYTLDSLKLVEQNWPTVKNLCFWFFRQPVPTHSYPDYFAFVTSEFETKPIYDAVKAYSRGMGQ